LGEFLPFKTVSGWLLNYLNIPMSDFSAGEGKQKPIRAAGQTIGLSICYEDAFGEEIIRALPEATFLVNVSEDAWFGNSLAPHQRLQISRMRALETGRVMLRAANTGLSAVIDSRGEVVVHTPQFQPYVLTREIQPLQGATPYTIFGNWAVITLTCLLAGLGWAEQNRLGSRIFPWKSSRREDA
jgi:apolipoprotein N-acyltransferase